MESLRNESSAGVLHSGVSVHGEMIGAQRIDRDQDDRRVRRLHGCSGDRGLFAAARQAAAIARAARRSRVRRHHAPPRERAAASGLLREMRPLPRTSAPRTRRTPAREWPASMPRTSAPPRRRVREEIQHGEIRVRLAIGRIEADLFFECGFGLGGTARARQQVAARKVEQRRRDHSALFGLLPGGFERGQCFRIAPLADAAIVRAGPSPPESSSDYASPIAPAVRPSESLCAPEPIRPRSRRAGASCAVKASSACAAASS